MKMIKNTMKLFPIIMLCLMLLVGCGNKKPDNTTNKQGEGTAYGIVDKGYVGMVKVKIKNGVVEDVVFDEAFLPHTWANLDVKVENDNIPEDVVLYSKEELKQAKRAAKLRKEQIKSELKAEKAAEKAAKKASKKAGKKGSTN